MTKAQTTAEHVPMSTLLASLGREPRLVSAAPCVRSASAPSSSSLEAAAGLGEASQAELADADGVDRGDLASIAFALSGRGVVDRTRHETDRRRYVLRLSRAGTGAAARGNRHRGCEQDLLSPLDDDSASSSTPSCGASPTGSSWPGRRRTTPRSASRRSRGP